MKTLILLVACTLACRPALAKSAKNPEPSDSTTASAASVKETEKRTFLGMINDVEVGIQMVRAESLTMGRGGAFPSQLDSQADGPCLKCFADVLGEGVSDVKWQKKGGSYIYTGEAFSGEFTYDAGSGKITIVKPKGLKQD